MQRISSKDNSLIKHIKKLKEKKYRQQYGEYVVEGLKLIKEAINENAKISKIIICESEDNTEMIENHLRYEIARFDCVLVPHNIFQTLSDVETPQGIMAIIEKSHASKKIDFNTDIIVALDDVQDPGNLGTILRTIDSIGLKQVLVSKNTVDCYNSKVIRSTIGAIFRVNVIECDDLCNTLTLTKNNGFKIMVTSLKAKKSIYDVKYQKKVIVVGNEANGVSESVIKLADEKLIIPMRGKTESLNVAVATGVILYEYVRQSL